MSVIFAAAADAYATMREEFELYRHALYLRAVEACNGELLNRDGRAQGIDAYRLFTGSAAYAERWASEELLDWWAVNGRPTVAEYERGWWADRGLTA